MVKITWNHGAKVLAGVALVVLLAGQWALVTGPLSELSEQGRMAAENSNMAEFAAFAGLHTLLTIALPLVFGAIGICVMAAFLAFTKMENRRLAFIRETDKGQPQ